MGRQSANLVHVARRALGRGATPLVALWGLSAVACGPSVQALHEGSVRFEHCYRLDLDPGIAPSHRKACWGAWSERYSYGASRDRIEYAQRRVAAIERGEEPPGLRIDSGPPQAATPEAPTDVHAPPPRVARPVDGVTALDEPNAAPAADATPGDACVQACRVRRRECLPECRPDDAEACPCEGLYSRCMVTCFQ